MGVIYLPVKQELYFAEEHIGAYKLSGITSRGDVSLEELMASATRLPAEAARDKFVIVASRSHLTPETESYIEEMKRQHAEVELVSKAKRMYIPVLHPPWNGILLPDMLLHVRQEWKFIRREKKNRFVTIKRIC